MSLLEGPNGPLPKLHSHWQLCLQRLLLALEGTGDFSGSDSKQFQAYLLGGKELSGTGGPVPGGQADAG